MTPAELQRQQASAMMERELQEGVRGLCAQLKIRHYHTHDSRRSDVGFPDSVIAHRDGPIFAELKREKRRPTADQVVWIDYLAMQGLRVFIWRPTHYLNGTIAIILGGGAAGAADGRWDVDARCVIGDKWSVVARKRGE